MDDNGKRSQEEILEILTELQERVSRLEEKQRNEFADRLAEVQAVLPEPPKNDKPAIGKKEPKMMRKRPKPKSKRKSRDKGKIKNKEFIVGKYIIPVLAVLILLIAAGSFMSLVWEYVPNVVKWLLIGSIGAGLTWLGLKVNEKGYPVVAAVLSSLGAGLVFISIVAGALLFEIYGAAVVLVLVLVWVVAFRFVHQKIDSIMTLSVVYLGVLISVILGFSDASSFTDLIILAIFYLVTIGSLKYMGKDSDTKEAIINAGLTLMTCVPWLTYLVDWNKDFSPLPLQLVMTFVMLSMLVDYRRSMDRLLNNNKRPFVVTNINRAISILSILFIMSMAKGAEMPEVWTWVLCIVISVVYTTYLVFGMNFLDSVEIVAATTGIGAGIIGIQDVYMWDKYGLAVLFLFIGFLMYLRQYRYGEVITDFFTKPIMVWMILDTIFLCNIETYDEKRLYVLVPLGLFNLGILTFCIYLKKMQLAQGNRKHILFYQLSTLFILSATIVKEFQLTIDHIGTHFYWSYTVVDLLLYVICVATLIFIEVVGLLKVWDNDGPWYRLGYKNRGISDYLLTALMTVASVAGMYGLFSDLHWAEYFILIVTLLALSCAQIWRVWDRHGWNKYSILWAFGKMLILTWCIMCGAIGIEFGTLYISVANLLMATVAIILGFKIRLKSLRLYGLTLTIIAVFKFLFVDLDSDNSIQRIIALFVGGLLCLIIGIGYNIIEKKMKENEIQEETLG